MEKKKKKLFGFTILPASMLLLENNMNLKMCQTVASLDIRTTLINNK